MSMAVDDSFRNRHDVSRFAVSPPIFRSLAPRGRGPRVGRGALNDRFHLSELPATSRRIAL